MLGTLLAALTPGIRGWNRPPVLLQKIYTLVIDNGFIVILSSKCCSNVSISIDVANRANVEVGLLMDS